MHNRFLVAFCLGILLCLLLGANLTRAVNVIPGFSHPESIAIASTQNISNRTKIVYFYLIQFPILTELL